jgi:hypothetical protein
MSGNHCELQEYKDKFVGRNVFTFKLGKENGALGDVFCNAVFGIFDKSMLRPGKGCEMWNMFIIYPRAAASNCVLQLVN